MDSIMIVVLISIFITLFCLLFNEKKLLNINQNKPIDKVGITHIYGFRSVKELDEFVTQNKESLNAIKEDSEAEVYFLARKHIKLEIV